MARDVEFDVVANDKVDGALSSAERKFKASQKKIEDNQKSSLGRSSKAIVDAVESFSPKLASSLTKAFAGAGDAAGPILIAGVAAAAPLIGALVNSAIAAGVAVGVAGIGVALVAQDARVKAAGARLGKSLFASLEQDAAPFIRPVLDAIDLIQAKFTELQPTIQRIFSNASKFVAPLVGGITHAIAAVVGGVDKLVAKSGGTVDALSTSISRIGDSVGNFLANIDTKSAVGSINALTTTITGVIDVLGPFLNGLSKIYAFFNKFAPSILSIVGNLNDQGVITKKVAGQSDDLAASFQGVTDAEGQMSAGVQTSAQSFRDLKAAQDAVYQANRTLYSTTTDVAKAFGDANKAAKENGRTLSVNTAKGQANRTVLSGLASDLNANYEAFVKVNGAGGKANALASTLRGKFIALAEKMGASSATARGLADDLLGIPNVQRRVTVETAQADAAAEALKRKLAGIKDRSVYVNVAFNQGRINKVQAQLDRIGNSTFDANDSFGMVAPGSSSGLSRTDGPTSVNVNQALAISLDGTVFRQYTARQIQASTDRQAWRQRVGTK